MLWNSIIIQQSGLSFSRCKVLRSGHHNTSLTMQTYFWQSLVSVVTSHSDSQKYICVCRLLWYIQNSWNNKSPSTTLPQLLNSCLLLQAPRGVFNSSYLFCYRTSNGISSSSHRWVVYSKWQWRWRWRPSWCRSAHYKLVLFYNQPPPSVNLATLDKSFYSFVFITSGHTRSTCVDINRALQKQFSDFASFINRS